jgi:hypothetical protein
MRRRAGWRARKKFAMGIVCNEKYERVKMQLRYLYAIWGNGGE